MPFQRIEQSRQKGDQTFRALAIVRVPCLHKRVRDLGSIARLTRMPSDWPENVLAMRQEPPSIGAMIASRLSKFIQKHAPL